MASVRPLKTVWQLRFYDADRSPQTTTNSIPQSEYTKREAEREADWRQQLYDRGRYDPWTQAHPDAAAEQHLTVHDAVEQYLEAKRDAGERGESGGWTPKTYRSSASVVRAFARHVGVNTLVSRITERHVRTWVYRPHLAQATRRGRWALIHAILGWWDERDWIDEPPQMPGRPEKRRRLRTTLTVEDLEALCDAYDAMNIEKMKNKYTNTAGVDWHTDAWRVTFYQGFRRSEVLSLRVRNVRPDEGLIQIGDRDYVQKGKHETLIPLVDEARDVFAPYLEKDADAYVFPGSPKNDRVSRRFRKTVDYAAEHGFVDFDPTDVDFYTLRHSCCTHWLREGRRLIWVNHLMRHAKIETTMEYIHLLPTHLREMYTGL